MCIYRAYNKLLRHVNAPTLVANASTFNNLSATATASPQKRDTLRTRARLEPPPQHNKPTAALSLFLSTSLSLYSLQALHNFPLSLSALHSVLLTFEK